MFKIRSAMEQVLGSNRSRNRDRCSRRNPSFQRCISSDIRETMYCLRDVQKAFDQTQDFLGLTRPTISLPRRSPLRQRGLGQSNGDVANAEFMFHWPRARVG